MRRSLLLLSLLACAGDKAGDGFGGGSGDSGHDPGGEEGGDEGGDGGGDEGGGHTGDGSALEEEEGVIPAYVATSTATWNLLFDEEAEAAGFSDCAYNRTWSGVQTLELDYLCPECDLIARGTSVFGDGADCYESVFGKGEAIDRIEQWGLSADGRLFRSNTDQMAMGELTTVTRAEGVEIPFAWSSEYELTDGGLMTLSAEGSLTYVLDKTTLLPDPWPERTEPYECGWPMNDPGTLELDYSPEIGGIFPNVRLRDACGEKPALWDFYGAYLVLDTAQPDCGPCRSMAASVADFEAAMDAAGIPAYSVTFLGNGLADPTGTPDEETFTAWEEAYPSEGPLLYDRGFGYAMFADFAEQATGESFGYPTWILVDPEMRIVKINVGFSSWDDIVAEIEAHAGL